MRGWFRKKRSYSSQRQNKCLAEIAAGQQVIITGYCGRGKKRLYSLGLVPGMELRVIFSNGAGAMLLQVGNSNISISPSLSQRILVIQTPLSLSSNVSCKSEE